MKKIFRTISVFASLICAATACNFLEVEKLGKSDIDGYFEELTSLEGASYGIHHLALEYFNKYMLIYPEVAADEINLSLAQGVNSTWEAYYNFTRVSSTSDETGALGYIWKDGYNIIHNCNQIIGHADNLRKIYPNSVDEINGYVAQAYLMRALIHFNINLAYGQNYTFKDDHSHLGAAIVDFVPALTDLIPRSSVGAVYALVVSDIENAISLFPASYKQNIFFLNPLAAKALRARVALYMGDWPTAVQYATEVIDAKPLTPRADYKAMFNNQANDGLANQEVIFRLDSFQSSSSNNMWKYYYDGNAAVPSSVVTSLFPEKEEDIRYASMLRGTSLSVTKFDSPTLDVKEKLYSNVILFRSSEMYLVRAEALCHQHKASDAAGDIESLRTRALGSPVTVNFTDESDMLRIVAEERVRELCFEGHRLWDLARTHSAIIRDEATTSNVPRIDYPDYRYVLPLPQTELDANKNMVNNPDHNE